MTLKINYLDIDELELITMFNQYNGYGGGKPNIAQEFNSLKASALRAGSEALRIKVDALGA